MILVDNSKKCSAIVHLVTQPSLENCPQEIRPIFDASRKSEFHTFLDGILHVWIGLGDEETLTLSHVKSAAAIAAKTMRKLKQTEYQVDAISVVKLYGIDCVYDLCTGIALSLYQYKGFSSKPDPEYSCTAYLQGFEDRASTGNSRDCRQVRHSCAEHHDGSRLGQHCLAIYMNPAILAQKVAEAGKETGCEVKVVDIAKAKELGMNLFLGVGLSSDSPCSVVVLRYMGDPDDKEVTALVGKGVTMDTGGYSLKTGKGMITMKTDMGGAAAVTAATCALARNKAKTNVVAVVPIVENRLSNTAHTPGDVIIAMNGKSVEIRSTDAEGRLILADAITYAIREEKADRVVDVATLTGAIVQAYGKVRAGVMTNNDLFEDELLRAGARASEKFVDLPTDEEYFDLIKWHASPTLLNSSTVTAVAA